MSELTSFKSFKDERGYLLPISFDALDFIPKRVFIVIGIGSEEISFYVDDGIVEFKNNSLSILTSNIFDINNSDKAKIQEMIKEAESNLADEKLDDQIRFIISQKVEVLKSLSLY